LLSIRSGPVARVRHSTLIAFLISVGEIKNSGAISTLASRIDSTEEATICQVTDFKPSSFVWYTSEKVSATKLVFPGLSQKQCPAI
jgi:hypothetical protein